MRASGGVDVTTGAPPQASIVYSCSVAPPSSMWKRRHVGMVAIGNADHDVHVRRPEEGAHHADVGGARPGGAPRVRVVEPRQRVARGVKRFFDAALLAEIDAEAVWARLGVQRPVQCRDFPVSCAEHAAAFVRRLLEGVRDHRVEVGGAQADDDCHACILKGPCCQPARDRSCAAETQTKPRAERRPGLRRRAARGRPAPSYRGRTRSKRPCSSSE